MAPPTKQTEIRIPSDVLPEGGAMLYRMVRGMDARRMNMARYLYSVLRKDLEPFWMRVAISFIFSLPRGHFWSFAVR